MLGHRLKKGFIWLALGFMGITGFLTVLVITLGALFFFDPDFLVNPKTIGIALDKTALLKSWSWERGEIHHKWIRWNHRQFDGTFKNLCFLYDQKSLLIDSCLEEVSWNVDLKWEWGKGFTVLVLRPLVIHSQKTIVKNNQATPTILIPPYLKIWEWIWAPVVPDLAIVFQEFNYQRDKAQKSYQINLEKKSGVLKLKLNDYEAMATKSLITVSTPDKKIHLPKNLKTHYPLSLRQLKLVAQVHKTTIAVVITGVIERSPVNFTTNISKSLLNGEVPESSFWREVFLKSNLVMKVEKINEGLKRLLKPPYSLLPAPFNSMEGSLVMRAFAEEIKNDHRGFLVKVKSSIDLKGAGQFVVLDLWSDFPYHPATQTIGPLRLEIDLKKIVIHLPKLPRTKFPQLRPDPRFVKELKAESTQKIKLKKKREWSLSLQAKEQGAVLVKTNLLDEILKLSFSLLIEDKKIQEGFLEIWPLNTTVFKRPLSIRHFKLLFARNLEARIFAQIDFHLPDYLVKLVLEGPLSKPRQAFSSVPPLPHDDIIAVLLFGRPLSALPFEDQTVTKNAGQIISQGVLSLAVLYYFAGSRIESIGFDPEAKVVSAQIGLGRRDSFYVKGETSGGLNSYGIRHSLGKGWYIDSSVQKTTDVLGSRGNEYGVLLERILSY